MKSNSELEKEKVVRYPIAGDGTEGRQTCSGSGPRGRNLGRSTCWRGGFRWIVFRLLVTVMVITLMVVTITFAWMTITGDGIGGGMVVVFTLAVRPRGGKSGNLIGSTVLVRVDGCDEVVAPLHPVLNFRGRLALGIMVSILIIIEAGGRSFDVVQKINQSLQLTLGVLPGTCLGITEDLIQLGPHPGFALELGESRDIARGSVLVGIVGPDVLTPFRPSYGRNQGQIEMGWRENGRETHIQAEGRRAGDGNGQSVGGESTDGEGGESDFGEHDDIKCREKKQITTAPGLEFER
jgi:hypothetical protein